MGDHTETVTIPLGPGRVDEIRTLLARLARLPSDRGEVRQLLAECRTAITDLLVDRDDLIRANHAAGEELARWLGGP